MNEHSTLPSPPNPFRRREPGPIARLVGYVFVTLLVGVVLAFIVAILLVLLLGVLYLWSLL